MPECVFGAWRPIGGDRHDGVGGMDARKLQRYVAGHMNTTTGRVALQTLYNQAAQKALEEAKPAEVDSSGYNLAANACRSQLGIHD